MGDPNLHRVLGQIEALGPLTGSHVLVVRGLDLLGEDAGIDPLVDALRAQAVVVHQLEEDDEQLAAHVPLVVYVDEPDATLDVLDEASMEEAGWVRRERLVAAQRKAVREGKA